MNLTPRRLVVLLVMLCLAGPALADEPKDDKDVPASQPDQPVRQQIRIQAGGHVQIGGAVANVRVGGGGTSTRINRAPGKTEVEVKAPAGGLEFVDDQQGRRLKITDADGKAVFDGPVDTAEQRKKVSPEARKLFEQLKQHVHMPRWRVIDGMAEELADVDSNPLDAIFVEDAGAELSRLVGDFTVKVAIAGGKHRLTVSTKGKTVFEGPVDTAEQWAAIKDLPADVVAEARRMDENLAREIKATSQPDGR